HRRRVLERGDRQRFGYVEAPDASAPERSEVSTDTEIAPHIPRDRPDIGAARALDFQLCVGGRELAQLQSRDEDRDGRKLDYFPAARSFVHALAPYPFGGIGGGHLKNRPGLSS